MQDILTDNDYEVKIANGDFAVGLSDQQHQTHLLLFEKASFKEHPVACVGAANYLEDEDNGELFREISLQFTGDGMKVRAMEIKYGKLNIAADY